ncbi:MAG: histidinol dehydrogenase [Gemmatimonadetes bacterium]|nr:histidinol dehydrogenase [Gemmatimonadota bacterium]
MGVAPDRLREALARIPDGVRAALRWRAEQVRRNTRSSAIPASREERPDGTPARDAGDPVDAAGLACPGGKAAYPSSVLMNAISSRKSAGVKELVARHPARTGSTRSSPRRPRHQWRHPVFKIGGAHAVAALALAPQLSPGSTRSSAPATSGSPRRSGRCSGRWGSTWSRARPRC